jgi:hypothetical protein
MAAKLLGELADDTRTMPWGDAGTVFRPIKRGGTVMHATNGTNGTAHRNGDGRYANGNPGGPGRPRRATEVDYLRVLAEEVSLETWREIIRRARDDATKGDAKARDWIAKYLLGAPGELWSLSAIAQLEEVERAREEARA